MTSSIEDWVLEEQVPGFSDSNWLDLLESLCLFLWLRQCFHFHIYFLVFFSTEVADTGLPSHIW